MIIILAEETKRWLYNLDKCHSLEDRMKDLSPFIQKLVDSGYGRDNRREILTSGIKRYYRLVLQEVSGGRSIYRTLEEMIPQRRIKGLKVSCAITSCPSHERYSYDDN